MLFHKAPLALIKKYYPDYSGTVTVYGLQSYIIRKMVRPMVDRNIHSEDTFVDLGCGGGWLVKQLQQEVATAVGIDEVDSGFKKFSDLNLIQGSLYHLPIREGRADFAISLWVFEHLKKPRLAIAEIRRILKPKGFVLVLAPNLLNPLIMFSKIFPFRSKQWMLYTLNGIRKDTVLKTYFRANTECKLDRMFHEAGFEKAGFIYSDSPSYWLFSKFLFRCSMEITRNLGKFPFLKRFKMNFVAVYRKV
jgi:ubiquinone/menaquinone biosynthesis C-methylase UbiE